jgi:hypothetical protein
MSSVQTRIHFDRNIEVFLGSITIASACNGVLRKRFLKPGTIGLIPTGGFTGNVNYSKKALMWLVYREKTDGCNILHGGNDRVYRLPDVPNLSVHGFCVETGTFGCFLYGHTCLHFRDVSKTSVETLAERYDHTMQRLEKITRAGYQVIVQWECDFDSHIVETTRTAHSPGSRPRSSEFERRPLRRKVRSDATSL